MALPTTFFDTDFEIKPAINLFECCRLKIIYCVANRIIRKIGTVYKLIIGICYSYIMYLLDKYWIVDVICCIYKMLGYINVCFQPKLHTIKYKEQDLWLTIRKLAIGQRNCEKLDGG